MMTMEDSVMASLPERLVAQGPQDGAQIMAMPMSEAVRIERGQEHAKQSCAPVAPCAPRC
jgi:hypothetical protein